MLARTLVSPHFTTPATNGTWTPGAAKQNCERHELTLSCYFDITETCPRHTLHIRYAGRRTELHRLCTRVQPGGGAGPGPGNRLKAAFPSRYPLRVQYLAMLQLIGGIAKQR